MRMILHDEIIPRLLLRTAPMAIFILFLFVGICAAEPASSQGQESKERIKPVTVECLLPSQLRSVGDEPPRLAPRRKVTVTAEECKERGGEIIQAPSN